MSKLGIVMPVANEASSIANFLIALMAETRDWQTSVYLIMDNYSKDKTKEIILDLAKIYPQLRMIYFAESDGPVSCRLHGFKLALREGCDIILEMDSGFSHPPAKIPDIMRALTKENYDVVFMSRFMPGGGIENFPLHRRIISRGGALLSNLWLGMNLSDATSGYQAFKAHVLASLDLDAFISEGGIYSTEMKFYTHRYRYKEIPFTYVGSTSNFKMKWIVRALQILFAMKANEKRVRRTEPHAERIPRRVARSKK